jgi:hypothetical protein
VVMASLLGRAMVYRESGKEPPAAIVRPPERPALKKRYASVGRFYGLACQS